MNRTSCFIQAIPSLSRRRHEARAAGGLTTLLICLMAGQGDAALAQGTPTSAGPVGGLFGTRAGASRGEPAEELTFVSDGYAGYDDNRAPGGPEEASFQSGFVSRANVGASYRIGRSSRRFLQVRANGFLDRQPITRTTSYSLVGGDAGLNASSRLWGRNGGTALFGASYEPTVLFNLFGPLAIDPVTGATAVPGSVQGLTRQRWLGLRGSAGLYRNWTPRQRSDVMITTSSREPLTGSGWFSRTKGVSTRHSWAVKQEVTLDFSHSIEERRNEREAVAIPLLIQSARMNAQVNRRLGTRRFIFNVGGGANASRVTEDGRSRSLGVAPVATASMRADLFRGGVLSVAVSRDVSALEGVSFESFTSTAKSVDFEGLFGRRVQLQLSAARTGGSSRISEQGSFDSDTAAAQLQVAIARYCAVFTSYRYYNHELSSLPDAGGTIPQRFERHSVQIGLTLWIPVLTRY